MNKKVLMLTTVAILALLTSSMIAVSQAWWWFKKPKPEFVGYDFKAILGPPIVTYIDDSGFPVIIMEGYRPIESVIEVNVTINGEVYSYPDDFNYSETFHMESNAITEKVFIRAEATLTFNLPGHPTLTDWIVASGPPLRGVFELTGTEMFKQVEGFGIEESSMVPTGFYPRHFGFIKGWPL